MLKMAIYQYTLPTTVTMKLLYPKTVMSKPWRKSENQTKIYPTPTLPQNQLVNKCLVQSDILPNQRQQVHCITNSTSIFTIPTSDIYRRYQLLINKKACWMTIFILITVVVLTAVVNHTHYYFTPPFKEPDKPIVSPVRNLTWKELLAYGTTVHLKIRLQAARSEKTSQIYFLD